MRPVVVLALGVMGVAPACATSARSSPPTPVTQRVLATDEQGAHITTVLPNARTSIAAPPGPVLSAVATVYTALGLSPQIVDSARGLVAQPPVTLMRRLAGAPLSRYLTCGSTITGPRADMDRVTLSVVTTVRAEATGGSAIETALSAESRSVEGASTDRASCTSTGVLEGEIARSVAEKVGSEARPR